MKKQARSLTPIRFQILLITLITLIASLGIAGFIFAQTKLKAYAGEVSQIVAKSQSSEDSLASLNKLEAELDRLRGVNEKATLIAGESQSYQYQETIIRDLIDYAARSGVTISQFNFDGSGGASGTGGAAPAQPAAGGGIKTTTVSVTLAPPIDYRGLLTFLTRIEQSLTKMQVSSISLAKGGENDNTVSTDALTIEVYIH